MIPKGLRAVAAQIAQLTSPDQVTDTVHFNVLSCQFGLFLDLCSMVPTVEMHLEVLFAIALPVTHCAVPAVI